MFEFVLVLVGTVIGGGFASGREIGTYFMQYGNFSYSGMILFSVLFFLICIKVCEISERHDIKGADEFYDAVFGDRQGNRVSFFTAAFSFVVFCSMLSAMVSLFSYYIGINKEVCRIIIVLIFVPVMSKGFGGVKMVNYILVPVLVLGILFSGEKYLNNVDICMSADDKTIFLSVVSSIIYTCYNMITVIPAVVLLSGSNNRKVCLFSCVAASALLFACAVSVAGIINTDFAENMAFSIPIIKAVEGRSSFVRYTIIVSIIFSMATTAAAAGCWANDYAKKALKRKTYPFIMAAAYVMSMFDFSVFVDRMYFLFGAAAVYEVYKILKS